MVTMNVSLPEPMKDWVEAQAQTGRYSNASDYVRDLIRRDQERINKINTLQNLMREGLNSGEPQPFERDAFLERMNAQAER